MAYGYRSRSRWVSAGGRYGRRGSFQTRNRLRVGNRRLYSRLRTALRKIGRLKYVMRRRSYRSGYSRW